MFISPVYSLRLVRHIHPSVFGGLVIGSFSNATIKIRRSDPAEDSSFKIVRQLEHVFESYRMAFSGFGGGGEEAFPITLLRDRWGDTKNTKTFCGASQYFTDFRFSGGILEPNTREMRGITVTQFICSPWS
jgi:hypothetical protein